MENSAQVTDFTEFTIDRKLDNRRIPVDICLVKFSYIMGDKKIKRKSVRFKSRSGYCLDAVDNGKSVSFGDIGKLNICHSANTNAMNPQYEIYAYEHKEDNALVALCRALEKYRKNLLNLANSIPHP